MTLTGEGFVKPLTKCKPQWFALRPKEVHALPHCLDKECDLSSVGNIPDSQECTQGFLHLDHRLNRVLLKTRYARIYCHRALSKLS
jgi:hypothetical protein